MTNGEKNFTALYFGAPAMIFTGVFIYGLCTRAYLPTVVIAGCTLALASALIIMVVRMSIERR